MRISAATPRKSAGVQQHYSIIRFFPMAHNVRRVAIDGWLSPKITHPSALSVGFSLEEIFR